jgi:hypothetical protein|tara:strand:- start:241 stop:438 length:198 start_codon:yes stop_codon:yes gene_type:complete
MTAMSAMSTMSNSVNSFLDIICASPKIYPDKQEKRVLEPKKKPRKFWKYPKNYDDWLYPSIDKRI